MMAKTQRDGPLPCIVCGTIPDSAFKSIDSADKAQPHRATMFFSYGHYGSTIFDPQDDSRLEINVCDECLAKAGDLGRVWHSRHIRQPALAIFSQRWNPHADQDDA